MCQVPVSNLLKQWEMKTTVHLRPYPYINTNYFVAKVHLRDHSLSNQISTVKLS